MATYQFPGTDFHDANLDWIIEQVKLCLTEWASTQKDWETLRTDNAAFVARITSEWESVRSYIDNYFANLDVSEEISDKVDAMAANGSLLTLISNTVANSAGSAATTWIHDHLSQQSGYAVDTSLTVAGGAADAKATGDAFFPYKQSLRAQFLPYSQRNGLMRASGIIASSSTAVLYKAYIPEGLTSIFISGSVTWSVSANNPYCVLWFVADGQLMSAEGAYVPVTVANQTWDNAQITIPAGAEEIWYSRNMIVSTAANPAIDLDISPKVATLQTAINNNLRPKPIYYGAEYTNSLRALGIEIAAKANGCYYIPFNQLGMGVTRGNGAFGDSFYVDNIHPTALGGYNLAYGVWSYLSRIPCWYTSNPGTAQPIDGTQWQGKTWYAYGTSLTAYANSYVSKVAAMSGLTVFNKGVAGGALVTNRNVYNALVDLNDGKLDADLITIEVGANDTGYLGYPWSLDNSEFFGALNAALKIMFEGGIKAQVVIMSSYTARYQNGHPENRYDVSRTITPT